ncbi:hypothetical protein GGX14DRAFT_470757 [Mycena pura]|uniref:Uncharacterized protein n=1 Tax=Mycena pura TaxID=153505 RepID=A0AAD6V289_9AGAR|nr:hypothetical protein GGX14DRAFT_470757 [Mycena pura]
MPTKIPKPKWSSSEILQATNKELRATMGWSEHQFDSFPLEVRKTAKSLGLHSTEPAEKQDPDKWTLFVSEVRARFALDDFEDHWPLRFYWNKYVYLLRLRQAQSNKENQKEPKSISSSSAPHCESVPVVISSIDYDLQAIRSGSPSQQSSASSPPSQASPIALRYACVFCGIKPSPVAPIIALATCFLDQPNLCHAFAAAGVVTDHHFTGLCRLNERPRNEVLARLVEDNVLTHVERVLAAEGLEKYIKQNVNDKEGRTSKAPRAAVPRPPAGLEKLLALHVSGPEHVQRHMREVDANEYFALVDLVERTVPQYLDVDLPFDAQDEAQIAALVDAVCMERPALRRYDDAWPVALHVRRFMSARAEGLPGTPRAASVPPTALVHECYCPLSRAHPAARVPPVLATMLAANGVPELGPVFLALGVRTDANMCDLSLPRRKEQLLAGLPKKLWACSTFQEMMLRHVVKHIV